MGYRVYNGNSSFLIEKENLPKVLERLRVLPEWEGADVSELSPMFQRFGLDISRDLDGDVTDLFLASEYLSATQEAVFHAIAPFVTPESYMMFIGEDAAQFAWVFRENPGTRVVEAV